MLTEVARLNMIKQQLRPCEVLDDRLLRYLDELPREAFVPEGLQELAYSDTNIPIGHDQVMMTPFEESSMLQALKIQPHETVLEIGTGTGYVTALLAKMSKFVVSVEHFADFTLQAKAKLDQFNIKNVELITANGARGYVEKAPFDVIVFTGSLPAIPKILRPQLLFKGRLFAILGSAPLMEANVITRVEEHEWQTQKLFETCIQPLLDIKHPSKFVF